MPTAPQPFAYEVRGRCALSGSPALLSGSTPGPGRRGGRWPFHQVRKRTPIQSHPRRSELRARARLWLKTELSNLKPFVKTPDLSFPDRKATFPVDLCFFACCPQASHTLLAQHEAFKPTDDVQGLTSHSLPTSLPVSAALRSPENQGGRL